MGRQGGVVGSGKGESEISDRRNVRHSTVRFTVFYQNLVEFMFSNSSPLWILPKSLKSADENRLVSGISATSEN